MKLKAIMLLFLALFLLGTDSCPTEPEEEKVETIEMPPDFPEISQ